MTDHNDNSDILNEHENWLLSLNDDGTPRDLTSYFYKEINFENERLKIEQEISIKQISNENILNTPFLIHSNAYLKTKKTTICKMMKNFISTNQTLTLP
ncbi:hypothetical protein [Vibrio cholerae]|uniref:hypothetical protein n=2 Tax=Vibrio cholerae TaxID=666 RepID=UPI0021AEA0C9|nr:hypothetical protein [Vibrio cholerae]